MRSQVAQGYFIVKLRKKTLFLSSIIENNVFPLCNISKISPIYKISTFFEYQFSQS